MKKSETISNLAAALCKFQAEVKQPKKDAKNPFFKSLYTPLENVVEVITETAKNHGLSFVQYPVSEENKIGIVTVVLHNSGEYIETEPIYVTPSKNDPQGAGSAITYLKRYSLSAVFGITSDQDDDGNAASQPAMPSTVADAVKRVAEKTGKPLKEVYSEFAGMLKIEKESKDLTEQEKKALISLLNKQ